ncbi:MAG: hypothetical protein ACMVP2_01235 [Imperialibacter sp.]|uniref:hypothetical protein n=1 Tax=Imperialibacter sp. TaxID=2038411 RepID=UPI003A84C73E
MKTNFLHSVCAVWHSTKVAIIRRLCRSKLFLSLLASAAGGFGQVMGQASADHQFLQLGYFGKQISRPGISASKEAFHSDFDPFFEGKKSSLHHRFSISVALGMYTHPGNHTGLFTNVQLGYALRCENRFYWKLQAGPGLLRTFLTRATYEVGDDLSIRKKFLAGNYQYMPLTALEFGKEPVPGNHLLSGYYLKVGAFLQYPHNTMWLPNPTFEAGTFIPLNPK